MFRLICATILFACTTMAIAAPPPAPALAPPPPSSQPTATAATAAAGVAAQQLHEQAIDAMRLGELDVASALMEKAYAATPAEQRTRPLVLNRAILDLTQRVNVMRGVKDVHQYLREHPEQDEQATNILGAALNVAADTPRLKNGTLWRSALREWERRNDQMNDLRPGYRRWGTHWLEEQQYQNLQDDRAAIDRAVNEQAARVERARSRLTALAARHQALGHIAQDIKARMPLTPRDQKRRRDNMQIPMTPTTPSEPNRLTPQEIEQRNATAWAGTLDARERAAMEVTLAMEDVQLEEARLAQLKRERGRLRPKWPATFDPIDPTALTPPPPPPPDPTAIAAIVAETAKERERMKNPFGDSGTMKGATPPAAATTPPSTAPAAPPPANVPFGPRRVDKQAR